MAQSDDMNGQPEGDGSPPRRPRRFPEAERRAAAPGSLDLEPLMTVCPQCGTRFRVTESQLQAARGRVRCGACGSVFDGVDQLVLDAPREFASTRDAERALDELMAELLADTRVVPPPRAAEPPPASPEAMVLETSRPAVSSPDEAWVESADETPVPVGTAEPATPEAPTAAGPSDELPAGAPVAPAVVYLAAGAGPERLELAPPPGAVLRTPAEAAAVTPESSSADAPAPPSPFSDAVVFGPPRRARRRWIWPLAVLGVLVVTAQVLWFRFDVLVRDPAWRPLYGWICGWAGCELPVQRAPALIRTRNLTVQSAGADTGELLVRVLIVNEAEFPQPFPGLELRFSELNGAVVAGHRFLPAQYLAGDARNLQLMPVRTPVQLELRIPDPGPHAVNYQLDLR